MAKDRPLSRPERLYAIWCHIHADYRSVTEGGQRCVLVLRTGVGTCFVPLGDLTSDEIDRLMPTQRRNMCRCPMCSGRRNSAKTWSD